MGAYSRVQYHGHTVNVRTRAMLQQAEDYLGYQFTILQGSYSSSVGASAGTHSGGGAVDLAPHDWDNKVKAMRLVGFAAWHRIAIPGTWSEHIHCIALQDRELSSAAVKQVQDYYAHLNGLANHYYDNEWRPTVIVPFQYPLELVDATNCFAEYHKDSHWKALNGVRRIQLALNRRSGTRLLVDGIFGPLTRGAFNRYSRQTGTSGRDAMVRLGLALYRVIN